MKRLAAVLFIAGAYGLVGCSPKHPIKAVSLEIISHDEFALDGKTVNSSELGSALHALVSPESMVCITISAANATLYDDVPALMQKIRDVDISCIGKVGVVG